MPARTLAALSLGALAVLVAHVSREEQRGSLPPVCIERPDFAALLSSAELRIRTNDGASISLGLRNSSAGVLGALFKPAQGDSGRNHLGEVLSAALSATVSLGEHLPPTTLAILDATGLELAMSSSPPGLQRRIREEILYRAVSLGSGRRGVQGAIQEFIPDLEHAQAPHSCGKDLTDECEDDEFADLAAFDFLIGNTDRHTGGNLHQSDGHGASSARRFWWLDNDGSDLALDYATLPVYADRDKYWTVQRQVHSVRMTHLLRGSCVRSAALQQRLAAWSSPPWMEYLRSTPACEQSARRLLPGLADGSPGPDFTPGGSIPGPDDTPFASALAAATAMLAFDRDDATSVARHIAVRASAACGDGHCGTAAARATAGPPEALLDWLVSLRLPCGTLRCTYIAPDACGAGGERSAACLEACADALLSPEARQRIEFRMHLLLDHYMACDVLEADAEG